MRANEFLTEQELDEISLKWAPRKVGNMAWSVANGVLNGGKQKQLLVNAFEKLKKQGLSSRDAVDTIVRQSKIGDTLGTRNVIDILSKEGVYS